MGPRRDSDRWRCRPGLRAAWLRVRWRQRLLRDPPRPHAVRGRPLHEHPGPGVILDRSRGSRFGGHRQPRRPGFRWDKALRQRRRSLEVELKLQQEVGEQQVRRAVASRRLTRTVAEARAQEEREAAALREQLAAERQQLRARDERVSKLEAELRAAHDQLSDLGQQNRAQQQLIRERSEIYGSITGCGDAFRLRHGVGSYFYLLFFIQANYFIYRTRSPPRSQSRSRQRLRPALAESRRR